MKKLVSIFLATAMLFALASVNVFATDTGNINDNLVVHYDFEGETIAEALTDKAPAGKFADDLSQKSLANPVEIDTENGVVENTIATSGLFCLPSEDTRVVTGESTWFTRFKINDYEPDTAKEDFFIIEMRTFGTSSSRPFALHYVKDTNAGKQSVLSISVSDVANQGVNKAFNKAYSFDDIQNRYLNIAIVVNYVAGKYVGTLYISTGLPADSSEWSNLYSFNIGVDIAPVTEANSLNLLSNGSVGCPLGVKIDDVRLYDKALNLEEIATIIPNGSFDREIEYKACQETLVSENKFDIRFIATLDSLNYDKAGFEVSAQYDENSKDLSYECSNVYKNLSASVDGNIQTVTADSLYGKYIVALVIKGIPADNEIIFTVRPYAEKDGVRTYSNAYSVVYSAGNFVTQNQIIN